MSENQISGSVAETCTCGNPIDNWHRPPCPWAWVSPSGRWHVMHEAERGEFGWSGPTLKTDDLDAAEREVERLEALGYKPVGITDDQGQISEGGVHDVDYIREVLEELAAENAEYEKANRKWQDTHGGEL
jgi:hypothetical protein